jgi:membrane-associated protein
MEILIDVIDFFIHLDKYLFWVIQNYGSLTYLILFAIIFCETGLVVTPILPGDSLIFAAGAFAAGGSLKLSWLWGWMLIAAIGGNTVNYRIGALFGAMMLNKKSRWIKQKHLDETRRFYDKHGDKTVIITRFFPIVRTIAPFAAGVARMPWGRFMFYNVVGGTLWVSIFLLGGYFFGNLEFVRHNFTLVIFAIIGISLLPALYKGLKRPVQKTRKILSPLLKHK